MTENPANSGLSVAHTPAVSGEIAVDEARAAKVGTVQATAEAAMAGLAGRLGQADEPEQASLLLGEEDSLFAGPVRHVAKIRDDAKRARGRPAGSKNRASQDLANYLLSLGYRDPALNLADLANADPWALAIELAGHEPSDDMPPALQLEALVSSGVLKRSTVAELIIRAQDMRRTANVELMPYFHAKKPQEINANHRVLGVMVIADESAAPAEEGATMDLTRVDAPR